MWSWPSVCLVAGLALGCGSRRALESGEAAGATASWPDAAEIQSTGPSSGAGGAGAPSPAPVEVQPTDASVPTSVDASFADTSPADAPNQSDAESASMPRPYRAIELAVGRDHVCVILDDHKVKCWGQGGEGELGYGEAGERGATATEMGDALPTVDLGTGRKAVALSANRYTTCALLDDGNIKCWGESNSNGYGVAHGDGPNEMGDNLPPLPLPAGRRVTGVGAGASYPMATLDDGTALAWSNGVPTISTLRTMSQVRQISTGHGVIILYADGTMSNEDFYGEDMPTLPFGEPVVEIGGSETAFCAVLASGRVACENPLSGLPASGAIGVDVGNNHQCGLFDDGSVRCWQWEAGCSTSPGLSYWCSEPPTGTGSVVVNLGQPAIAIGSSGQVFSCALLADGTVKCWGGGNDCTPNDAGGYTCEAPAQLWPVLGGSVETKVENGVRVYGAWHAINLGTHP
jgi:hypothetical protein